MSGAGTGIDWPKVLEIADASVKTSGSIDSATEALARHVTDLQSAMEGFGAPILERMQSWQKQLNEISAYLKDTKKQLEKIADDAKRLRDVGNQGGR